MLLYHVEGIRVLALTSPIKSSRPTRWLNRVDDQVSPKTGVTGLVGFLVQSAQDDHIVGVCSSAVKSQHHRHGRAGVILWRHMHRVAPVHAFQRKGSRVITGPQACVTDGHKHQEQRDKAHLLRPYWLPNDQGNRAAATDTR
jgi:hypothetical protein